MKNRFLSIFSLIIGLVAMTACTSEVEDKFDTTAAERADLYKSNVAAVLKNAPNGWCMEYFTGYGGYNVFCKFGDGVVTVASEQVGTGHEAGFNEETGKLNVVESHFKLEQSQGVILSFDGYNDIFHYFSTPVNPDYGYDGEGLEGDFEFRVQTACADSVVLIGRKHMAKIRMYPVENGLSWEDYVNSVKETSDYMASRSYTFEIDGSEREISVSTTFRIMTFTWKSDDGENQRVSALYIVTKDGYKFYRPYMVDSCYVDGFDKGETQDFFYMKNGKNARLWTYVPPLAESLKDSPWYILYDDLGEYAQPKWEAMRLKLKTSGSNKTPERLFWAIIGTYNNTCGMHLQLPVNYLRQGLTITSQNEEGDEVLIKWNSSEQNSQGRKYYNSYGLKDAMEPFVGTRGRTFKLESDSKRKPTYMILRDMNEPTNVIKLHAEETYYVYGELDNYENE